MIPEDSPHTKEILMPKGIFLRIRMDDSHTAKLRDNNGEVDHLELINDASIEVESDEVDCLSEKLEVQVQIPEEDMKWLGRSAIVLLHNSAATKNFVFVFNKDEPKLLVRHLTNVTVLITIDEEQNLEEAISRIKISFSTVVVGKVLENGNYGGKVALLVTPTALDIPLGNDKAIEEGLRIGAGVNDLSLDVVPESIEILGSAKEVDERQLMATNDALMGEGLNFTKLTTVNRELENEISVGDNNKEMDEPGSGDSFALVIRLDQVTHWSLRSSVPSENGPSSEIRRILGLSSLLMKIEETGWPEPDGLKGLNAKSVKEGKEKNVKMG
ncbi:hypothetical protein COLO4_22744 [Corchorus olitorius]|uniref:Uncharacterized protein n=1 Tax=Corchorus olitorius TaxID=93759 RepID=A0A1R3IKD1_9ROSI|nr:hypothetical protein COLO4_22744 [Corchorus olitorius]